MRGKKFDAHRKHFEEKERILKRENNTNIELVQKLLIENNSLLKENAQLIKENSDIKIKYEKLLEYSSLKEEDIIRALKKDQYLEQVGLLMNVTTGLRF